MGFLLDTNILSDLVRNPRGRIFDRIKEVTERNICTSIVVAAELRYGAAKKASLRLTTQLEAILHAIDVLAFEQPADAVYGELRTRLERAGQSIGANALLIAAHALALGHTVVTDNEREFSRVKDLRVGLCKPVSGSRSSGNAYRKLRAGTRLGIHNDRVFATAQPDAAHRNRIISLLQVDRKQHERRKPVAGKMLGPLWPTNIKPKPSGSRIER